MPILRITNGIDKLSDPNLLAKTNNIITNMTGNAFFVTPTPTLATLEAARDAFEAAMAVAKSGSTFDKAVKNQKKAALVDLLHTLFNYVLFTANGDAVIAKSAGVTISKKPEPVPAVTQANNQQLEDGPNSGELVFSFEKVKGAKSYIYQYTEDPLTEDSKWKSLTGTVRSVTFTGLEVGKRYWCRVVAIGINGQGVYSTPISRIVQ